MESSTALKFSSIDNCKGVCLRHNLVQTTVNSPKTIASTTSQRTVSPTQGNVRRFITFTFTFFVPVELPCTRGKWQSLEQSIWKLCMQCTLCHRFYIFSLLKMQLYTNISKVYAFCAQLLSISSCWRLNVQSGFQCRTFSHLMRFCISSLRDWHKNLRHFLVQSEVKPKPILNPSYWLVH